MEGLPAGAVGATDGALLITEVHKIKYCLLSSNCVKLCYSVPTTQQLFYLSQFSPRQKMDFKRMLGWQILHKILNWG